MYQVNVIDIENEAASWGEFISTKAFEVKRILNKKNASNNASNIDQLINKMGKLNLVREPCGFILQYVTKKTTVHALCSDKSIKRIADIDAFTNHKVKYMNHAYYELFPVIDGYSLYADSFKNGAVLRYEKENKKWYANNNPPTKGKIDQEGTFYFIPEEKDKVEEVIAIIKKSTRRRSPIMVNILGVEWDLNPTLPANGLPYTAQNINAQMESMKKSNQFHHVVCAKWNGIGSKNNNNTNNVSNCHPIKETNNESNKRIAITKLTCEIKTV